MAGNGRLFEREAVLALGLVFVVPACWIRVTAGPNPLVSRVAFVSFQFIPFIPLFLFQIISIEDNDAHVKVECLCSGVW